MSLCGAPASVCVALFVFFFNDTATTEIYTLSLHDALPISRRQELQASGCCCGPSASTSTGLVPSLSKIDRKSTRLNSSHGYHLVCRLLLEKKKKEQDTTPAPCVNAHAHAAPPLSH